MSVVLACKKDFLMKDGTPAFFAGKSYKIRDSWFDEWWEFAVESEVSDNHIMPMDDETEPYFEFREEE